MSEHPISRADIAPFAFHAKSWLHFVVCFSVRVFTEHEYPTIDPYLCQHTIAGQAISVDDSNYDALATGTRTVAFREIQWRRATRQ